MSHHIRIFPILFMLILGMSLFAQDAAITGYVHDSGDNPIIGANIYLEGTILGAASDMSGQFLIDRVPRGNFKLVITVIGYETREIPMSITMAKDYDVGVIRLSPQPMKGEPVIVTASKYSQNFQDVPLSVSSMNGREIRSRNIVTLDEALKYIPGLNMNADQVNIRGSSGYSKGVGSRVTFLLDGIPLLTGDTREINFDVIPTYLIDHIEVIKGAGSALYGSGALGGVINVITRDIEQKPHFYGQTYGGIYAEPSYEQWKWTDNNLYSRGISASYSQGITKLGFQGGFAYDNDDNYRKNAWRKRYSGSGKLQWSPSPFQRFVLSGNYMHQKRANFLYWKDLDNALIPPDDQLDDQVLSTRTYLSTDYRYFLKDRQFFSVKGLWFRNRFEDNISAVGGNKSLAENLVGEMQYNSQVGELLLISGFEITANSVKSNIFGDHWGYSTAIYLQGETPLMDKMQVTIGARYDYFDIDSIAAEGYYTPKLGLVYKPKAGLALRASAGLGFRSPSLAEVYTSTTSSGIQVIPNPELKPEKSGSIELGINYYFTNNIFADLAVFQNRFTDLIEGSFLETGQIQFQNVTRARIQGVEINLQGNLFGDLLSFGLGYTYTDPWDLGLNRFLAFRPRHLLYSTNTMNFFKMAVGIDYRYISKYDRIDEKLALVIPDAEEQVPAHILDFRIISPTILVGIPVRIIFQVKNVMQYNYIELIGSLAPPRQFILSLEGGI